MAEHSPGPWVVVKNEETRLVFVGPEEGPRYPLFRDIGNGQDWANARLIEAAPDLLAALIETLPSLSYARKTNGSYAKALAAIAQARGE
ncbi:hypothetical protein LCGC14_0734880 [marine sediment metagenome]|uniref:Uncharacterized protein n=1 Tax=marine sediment metagenome TaxID=412755 RepID=A0A0F9TFS4_9ZZZZ